MKRRAHDPELTYTSRAGERIRVRVTVVLADGTTHRKSLGLFESRDEAISIVKKFFCRATEPSR